MNKFQTAMTVVNDNKVKIITRTAIVAAGVIGVTLTAGFFKPADVEILAEAAGEVAKKVAE